MRTTRPLAAALLASAVLSAATACGPTAAPSGAAQAAPAPTAASPSPAGIEALTAEQILRKAEAASEQVTSVRLSFDVAESGERFKGSVAEDKSGNCAGTIGKGSDGSFDVLRTGGTVWIKPDAVFWDKSVAPGSSKKLGGKYLKGSAQAGSLKSMATFCDLGLQILKGLGKKDDGTDDTVGGTKSGTKQVGAVQAVVIRDQETEVAVAAQGEPYLVEMVQSGADAATMSFSDYEKPVTVTKPPAALVLDASKYLRG
ncbi:hypothetical protein [Kitasatospora sp. NPDC059571]|uniref:hypothetical protein n=1 Tax=Kitasatospora sp. NPDC059571 TaxID=3346871 RepID=UPI0036CF3A47